MIGSYTMHTKYLLSIYKRHHIYFVKKPLYLKKMPHSPSADFHLKNRTHAEDINDKYLIKFNKVSSSDPKLIKSNNLKKENFFSKKHNSVQTPKRVLIKILINYGEKKGVSNV